MNTSVGGKHLGIMAVAAAIACLGLGCAGTMPPPKYFEDAGKKAGEGESEIVVSRYDPDPGTGAYETRVFIDDQECMRLGAGETKTAIVPDGRHRIYAKSRFFAQKSRTFTVDAASSRTVFIERNSGGWLRYALKRYMDFPFDSSNGLPSVDGNETPQKNAVASFGQDLPKIAVYVTGDVSNNEKEALGTRMLASLVNSGRYIGIERSNSFLAEIEKEHIKQRSGDIDDNQISALGRQFGVKFVCIAAITPAFGDFQVSARIVDVETAQVIFIGESASSLKSMVDLAQVSDRVVKNMFGEQAVSARKSASDRTPTPVTNSEFEYALSHAAHYKYYKFGTRLGTAFLNFLPGIGSLVIMQDWKGAVTQWVLMGGGIALIASGSAIGNENKSIETPFVIAGVAMIGGWVFYNPIRASTYVNKMPKNMAFLENADLNFAVLPDKDGNIKGAMFYNMEF